MFIREKIQEFQTRLELIPKELMIMEALTKRLTVKVFVKHVTRMSWFSESFLLCIYFPFGHHLLYCHVY